MIYAILIGIIVLQAIDRHWSDASYERRLDEWVAWRDKHHHY